MNRLRLNTLNKNNRARQSIIVTLLFIAISLFAAILSTFNFGALKANALTIPKDYATGYGVENIDNLELNETFAGIVCSDKANKEYILQFTADVNGLVTLARISHNDSLQGYTFALNYGGLITLQVNYDAEDTSTPVSAGSFFGLGNDSFPFKGKLKIGGSQDTSIAIAEGGWRYLFNNLSNEASIVSNGQILYSSNATAGDDEEDNSFVFAKKVSITQDNQALDISGFRFGSSPSGTRVQGDGFTALFAGEVAAEAGSTCAIDLSSCFTANLYTVVSNDDDAAGLIARVGDGVNITVKLPSSFNCSVTSVGNMMNAGILIGTNLGTVTFTGDSASNISGNIDCSGSAGLIGANNRLLSTSKSVFDVAVNVNGLIAKGLRAGGILGTNKGLAELSGVTVTNCTFTKITKADAGRLGGVVGSLDDADGGLVVKQGASVSISNNNFSFADACYVGGYVGYWNGNGATVERVNVENVTLSINGVSGTFGGYIGGLATSGNFSLVLSGNSAMTADGLTVGTYGGVIGQVTSSTLSSTVLIQGDGIANRTVRNTLTNNGTNAVAGGVIGRIGSSTFVKVNNLTLNNSIVKSINSTRCASTADLAGNIQANGILDIGNLTLNDTQGSVIVGTTGAGSVVRLGGTITDNSNTVNNIVFQQDSSLIYKDSDCVYSGVASSYNDIGNYGQVVRNDNLNVITMGSEHQISFNSPLSATDGITLNDKSDFAKLAITFYTQGVFSGVSGYNSSNYTGLLAKTINLTANVDLTNTGIEQLTRPDSKANTFTGTFNGGGHTITLAIGQSLLDDTNNGVKNLSALYTNNARRYLGLFAAVSNATIDNLTIGGKIYTGVYNSELGLGSLAGYATAGLTVNRCTISTQIEITGGYTSSSFNMYVGGLVGIIENATSLTVKNSVLGAEISDSASYSASYLSRYFWGGLSGQVSYKGSSKINFTNNTITTKLTKTENYAYLQTGGLIGVLNCTNYTQVDLDGTTADVSLSTPNATGSVGGILGYMFTNCHLNNLNATYKGAINADSAAIGGLVHTLTGRLTIANGFSMAESTFATTKTNAEDCGLLLSDGSGALISVACPVGAFANVTADKFDLFAGKNISSYSSVGVAKNGGIVTIETGDGLGKIPTSSDWFAAINARQNGKTRYYFNVLGIKNASTVAERLLYWHINDYSYGNLLSDVKQEYLVAVSVNNNFTATAAVDMTGYCFYPTQKDSTTTINFNNYRLTFATPTNATAKQFYGMQAGLLSDVSATSGNSTVTLQNITLCGTVANLGNNIGSGALICGKISGNASGLCNLTVNNVILDGLKVAGDSGYRPLLINTLASYVTANISNISQSGYTGSDNVACSLIGCGGITENGSNSTYLNVTLQGIALDGSENSIFTNSTLFYDVKYVSATGSVIYNFTFAEDWGEGTPHKVTYGAELYFDKEQQKYFDCEIFVNPVTLPDESSVLYENFKYYLPYVFNGYNADGSSINRYLSVNRKGADFIEGWGTYENPYIINSPKQLIDLSKWLSGTAPFNEGWKINFPQGNWSSVSTLNLTGSYLVVESGGKLIYTASNGSTTELSTAVLLQYLAGAYYKIGENNLTLTSDFVGLGSASRPFHGVVHGNGKTLTLASPKDAIGVAGYGFINVANGCAIYGLNISYGDIALSATNLEKDWTATSAPNATTLTTSMSHFGGAIGWVVGGDNQIDNVTVSVASSSGSCNTAFGGYVGLISGGGVLVSDLGEVGGYNSNTNLYHNNYIGRVLNGYAIAIDGTTYDNGKNTDIVQNLVVNYQGDFTIPTISLVHITAHSAGFNGTNTFTIGNAEELLMLSYALNSGALHSTTGYAYGGNALSRYGDYSNVGATVSGIADGKYTDDAFIVALPAAYFGLEAQKALSSTQLDIKLTATAYDMSSYGNGFRGMSGTYSDSFIYSIKSFGNDSQKATITVNMNMPQYGYNATNNGDPSSDRYDPDSITSYGLFGRSACAVTFNNLILTGNICVTTINYSNEANYYSKSPTYHVGGLMGQNSSSKDVTVNNVSMNNFTVVSPNCAGGFVGYFSGGTLTVNNTVGSDLSQNFLVKGQKHTGGCVGFVNAGTANITGFEILDSTIEVIQRRPQINTGGQTGVGGVIGAIGSTNNMVIKTVNCSITQTAVVLYTNFYSTGDSVASGGLVGWANNTGSITAEGCMVDGCVIFAFGNYSGSNFPYENFKGSDSTIAKLSDDIKNNLLYNGASQSSVSILAYFLECSSSTSSYAIGSAGGLIGSVKKAVTLKDCTVTAKSAPMVIASLNDSAGLVSEQRAGVALTVENCTVSTQGHDMYIMGNSRAAGVMAYRSSSGAISLSGCNVVGTQNNPIRMVQFMYNTAEAGGLLCDVNINSNLTATNCRVSYCIIAGAKSSAIHTNTRASVGTFKNIHVDNNVIYSRNSYYAGGLFGEYTATYSLEGVYLANNYIIGFGGAGGLAGTATSGTLSGKYVIMENNTVCKGNQATNYTFAASNGGIGSAASTLYNTANPSFTNSGIIAGNNAATVKLTAVSCAMPQSISTRQKNFYSDSSTASYVIYNAYGAGAEYAKTGYTTEYTDKTPQQLAIEAMNYSASTGGGSDIFYGDSVTAGTPEKIAGLSWWVGDRITVDADTIKTLSTLVNGVANNSDLQLFCLSGNTDATIKGYLNMLTGGGFDAIGKSNGVLVVESYRYTVNADGSLTKKEGNGSVVYNNGTFKVGVYDNLEAENKTISLLSVNFDNAYTLNIPIFYTRSVNLKTFVMPVEGEQYNLNLFTSSSEPSGSLPINLSFGSSFTLYVEFNYNDVAMTLEGFNNFKKQIELTASNGQSDENAKIERGTAFILIDLNSSSPAGYSFYTLTLTADTRLISFADFTNGETRFAHVPLSTINQIGQLIENRLCKDTGSGCIYTEKYLLVVMPVHNANKTTYNMKAVIDEEHRAETNVIVRRQKEVYGQITVWNEPTIVNSAEYVDGSAEGKSFSNQVGETIKMQVENTITYPDGYFDTLQGQGGKVYETHILSLVDSNGNAVELPQRTIVKIVGSDSKEIFKDELGAATSQLAFSLGDVLSKLSKKSYTIELDFSKVLRNEFYLAFSSNASTAYTLVDTMYLSVVDGVLGVEAKSASKTFYVKADAKIKLAVVPDEDSFQNLVINLASSETDDNTNNGQIGFSINALFSDNNVTQASLSFSVTKKVYNDETGKYEYVALSAEEESIWQVQKGDAVVRGDTLTVEDKQVRGNYKLVIDTKNANLALTNYRLNVTLTAGSDHVSEYFIFLVCNINTDLG